MPRWRRECETVDSKTKNPKSRAQVDALVRRAFAGLGLASHASAVRELKDGWFNAAYEVTLADDRQVILKIAPRPGAEVMRYERDLMATEVATMRLVHANPAVPVPAVLYHDESATLCDSAWFFMEKVPGDNLDHVRASLTPVEVEGIDRHLGAILRELHAFRGEWFGYPGNAALRAPAWRPAFLAIIESVLEDAARKSVRFDRPAHEIRAFVDAHAPSLDEVREPRLVHWDAWDSNVFVARGRVCGLIDFERALWADPLMEAPFRALSWTGVTDAMRGYGKTTFSDGEQQRCWLYTLHLGLVMQTECAYRVYPNDDILVQARRMVGRALDWLAVHA
jgi:aminoglycoside phosphotransferase (APT) family kinase protein